MDLFIPCRRNNQNTNAPRTMNPPIIPPTIPPIAPPESPLDPIGTGDEFSAGEVLEDVEVRGEVACEYVVPVLVVDEATVRDGSAVGKVGRG